MIAAMVAIKLTVCLEGLLIMSSANHLGKILALRVRQINGSLMDIVQRLIRQCDAVYLRRSRRCALLR